MRNWDIGGAKEGHTSGGTLNVRNNLYEQLCKLQCLNKIKKKRRAWNSSGIRHLPYINICPLFDLLKSLCFPEYLQE